jgi:hypothetical protein
MRRVIVHIDRVQLHGATRVDRAALSRAIRDHVLRLSAPALGLPSRRDVQPATAGHDARAAAAERIGMRVAQAIGNRLR